MAVGAQWEAGTALLLQASDVDVVALLLLLAGLALVGFVAATGLLWTVLGDILDALRVLTGSADPTAIEEREETYVAVELDDSGYSEEVTLAQVHDTFGYWLARTLAADIPDAEDVVEYPYVIRRRIAGALPLKLVPALLYAPGASRGDVDRCRARVLDPRTVTADVEGGRVRVTVEEGVRPLQRPQADGGLVPTLFWVVTGTAVPALLVTLPMYPLAADAGPLLALELRVLVVLLASLALATLYHDTAILGGWDRVVPLVSDSVPDAVAAADDTPDPDRTARVDLATAESGATLRVLGTVEPTSDGLRVVDGVVSTRSRAFLLLATVGDAARSLLVAAFWALLAAGAGWVLWVLLG
jgi:hypothetical protein